MQSSSHYLILILFPLLLSCGDTQEETVEAAKAPVQQGFRYADSTLQKLHQLLDDYYAIKEALVKSDSAAAVAHAATLNTRVGAIFGSFRPKDSLSSVDYKPYLDIVQSSSDAIQKAKTLELQREIFETLSNNMYEMIKILKPAGIATYQQYCPMAFNDKGAYWLSDTSLIQNPYFGKKMLKCGEVREELRYQ